MQIHECDLYMYKKQCLAFCLFDINILIAQTTNFLLTMYRYKLQKLK